jgi:hypothetical protein
LLLGAAAMVLFATGCSSSATLTHTGPPSPTPIVITSTLAGLSSLPLRIHCEAMPSVSAARVSEVDFLIDGRLGWVEHTSPYVYGDDGNWLVTSFLVPGAHIFTVRVVTTSGQSATTSVRLLVAAPPAPPTAFTGTWARTVTPADVTKATSGMPPPAGHWELTIGPAGWKLLDPTGGGLLFDVGYLSEGTLEMRPTIEYPPFPNPNNGGFCADTDPIFNWTAAIGSGRTTLALHPEGHDPCGDRVAILEGTWSRVGQ